MKLLLIVIINNESIKLRKVCRGEESLSFTLKMVIALVIEVVRNPSGTEQPVHLCPVLELIGLM